ncbi:unnamed protein product [Cladocopium goreaui]|uniref:GDT1 family protein n=1 Tax=Cladocopium goreaui TaxID=2562237 RepID=A0A9P1CW66_9DINO|nr:unnamed protein product [Cladocopium goreaui]
MAYVDGWLAPCGLKGDDDEKDDKDEALLEVESTPSGNVKRNNIVVVALLGSLDDFTVYLIMAGSGIYTWYELILGTFLGCAVLASIVPWLSRLFW